MKIFTFICLLVFSMVSFADRIIIQGEPLLLEQRDNVYYVPNDYTPAPAVSYTYVNVGGVDRVCYLNPQPALNHLDMVSLDVEAQGTTTSWSCYAIDRTYFEVVP